MLKPQYTFIAYPSEVKESLELSKYVLYTFPSIQ